MWDVGAPPQGSGGPAPSAGAGKEPICLKRGAKGSLHRWRDSCSDEGAAMRNLTRLTALSGIVCVLGAIGGPAGLVACSDSAADDSGAGVSSVVFIKRQHTTVGDQGRQRRRRRRQRPGARLRALRAGRPARACSRRRAPTASLKNITADFPTADFNGADVSFDAQAGRLLDEARRGRPLPHLHRAARPRAPTASSRSTSARAAITTTSTRSTSPAAASRS